MTKYITIEHIQVKFQSYCTYYVLKCSKYKSEWSRKLPDTASMVPQETFSWWKQSYHENIVLDSYYDYLTSKKTILNLRPLANMLRYINSGSHSQLNIDFQ